jgi:TonB family protein
VFMMWAETSWRLFRPILPIPPIRKKRKAKYSGTVSLIIIVDASGDVTDAQVIKPAGLGLDEKAVETVRTWRFKPAIRKWGPRTGAL